jgi:predicted nicotinamide N-methyase
MTDSRELPETDICRELRAAAPALDKSVDFLPKIPGGWSERAFDVFGPSKTVYLPADPDAFLDDPAVTDRHETSGYMPYWAYVWPASLHLARQVASAPWPRGTRVLELGCGVGLAGLAAVLRGDDVVFSDYDPVAVELCLLNARRWGQSATGWVFDWRDLGNSPRFEAILGCEVIYELGNHDPLLNVLDHLLSDTGLAWFADAGRIRAPAFIDRLAPRGYDVRLFDEFGQPLAEPQHGKYQLLEIRRSSQSSIVSTVDSQSGS